MTKAAAAAPPLTAEHARAIAELRAGRGVRMPVGEQGALMIDRPLPFLFVHRLHCGRTDAGTADLLHAEAAYLTVGADVDAAAVRALVRAIAESSSERFGSFVLIEIWAEDGRSGYTIFCPEGEAAETTAQLASALEQLAQEHGGGAVELEPGRQRAPDGSPPLLTITECHELGVLYLGTRLPPAYRDAETNSLYPVYLRAYRGALSRALRRSVFTFAQVQTGADLTDTAALGTRTIEQRVWDADAELARVESTFRLLLLIAPTNGQEAWQRFRDGGYREMPTFHYRLLPVDPALLKRRLYNIDLESIADPALGYVLRDKRDELDKQISLLAERQTPNFLPGSIRLYGRTTPDLRALAHAVLAAVPATSRRRAGAAPVDAMAFASRAQREIAEYAAGYPGRIAAPQLRPDVIGLMVSDGVLIVGSSLSLDPQRVEALIHHEVGTHVLTHANGSVQPLRQLASGLADYDEFQEGLAVITEYLAGGLNIGRLRLLAGRVLAVASVEDGGDFMDTFRLLTEEHGFSPHAAFDITSRVHQAGGFTRDMIYLRGLVRVLELLKDGTPFESLFIGKFAAKHLPILHELRLRGVLREPPLRPRVLAVPGAHDRLERLRTGVELTELLSDAA